MTTLRIGTRRSRLALWQTEHIRQRLQALWPDLHIEVVPFTTRGDRVLQRALPEIGGKGLFTAELEAALRDGRIDLAVHSLKDLPTEMPPGLTLAAVPPRAEPHDAWVSKHGRPLAELPPEPIVGTSSQRRAAQVRLLRADAHILPLRGNVDTRVRKALDPAGPYDGVVLAWAGLQRLGLTAAVTARFAPDEMLPAPGQGALAVQARADDPVVLPLLQPLDDPATRLAVLAERAFLQGLGGGCALPVAAWARVEDGRLVLTGLFVTPQGQALRAEGHAALTADDARALGQALAADIRAQQAAARPVRRPRRPRVLVLRAPAQAPAFARALREAGFEPVLYPVLRIEPAMGPDFEAALQRLAQGNYDWLVLTSVNGVHAVQAGLERQGLTLPPRVRLAVIGPATAQAVRAWGHEPAVMPAAFVAEALAEALGPVAGQRLLLARADRARATLREMLRAAGATVDEVVAYHTRTVVPQTPPPAADFVAFTSPSTVEGLRAAYAHWQRPWPPAARVVCIGPITARAARAAGLTVHQVAQTYTIPGVVQALRAATSPRERRSSS